MLLSEKRELKSKEYIMAPLTNMYNTHTCVHLPACRERYRRTNVQAAEVRGRAGG